MWLAAHTGSWQMLSFLFPGAGESGRGCDLIRGWLVAVNLLLDRVRESRV